MNILDLLIAATLAKKACAWSSLLLHCNNLFFTFVVEHVNGLKLSKVGYFDNKNIVYFYKITGAG